MSRSKPLAIVVLIIFASVLCGEAYARIDGQAQTEFAKAFEAGKKLYTDGEHKEAAIKFLQALTWAKDKAETAEACFYLSLAYYGLGENDNAQIYLKKLFEAQPEREIDARLFSAGYVTLFYRTKSALAGQPPAKAEEKAKEEAKAREEEKKPVAVPGKAAAEPQVKKKGKFPWLIVGALVVAAGVVLYLVLNKKKGLDTGTISVGSTPAGAKVFLDGTDTGLTTACTLNNVSAGSHAVKLTKDGYADFQQSVTVMGGQTATVNAALAKNTIAVSSPSAGTTWVGGMVYDIRWQVDSGALAERTADVQAGVSFDIAKVKIELYKGGALISTVVAEMDNTGSYTWALPDSLAEGSDYKIRISCSTDANVFGESGSFTIWVSLYEFVTKWGSEGSGGGQFKAPWGMAVDNSGYVYVADTNNHRIQKFTGSGVLVNLWGSSGIGTGQFSCPMGITIDGAGFVYVTESVNNRIQKFTSNGTYVARIGGGSGTGDGWFDRPYGIDIDSLGNIYVTEYGNNRIQKFSSSGAFLTKWGSEGSGDGQFKRPYALAIDSSDNIYVADLNNHRIQKFNSNGTFISKFGGLGTGNGQFAGPAGITIDPSGSIFVTDSGGDRVQKFTAGGTFVTKWGKTGTENGQFDSPMGIVADGSGSIYVTEYKNSRVQKFRPRTVAVSPAKSAYSFFPFPVSPGKRSPRR